jgi:hypothetical protein
VPKFGPGRFVGFLLFVALQVAATHLLIGWALRRVDVTDVGAFNRAMQGQVNAEIVISGSSRGYRHYDPRIISSQTGLTCFNLSRNASQIDVQLGVLKAYLRHNRKPRLIVQNLDLQSLVLTKAGEIPEPAQYVPYLSDPDIYSCLTAIDHQLWKWKYLPLYAYSTEDTSFTWTVGLRSLVGAAPREYCFDGFSPMAKSWTQEFDRFKSAHPHGLEIPIDQGAVTALRELIALCREEGIRMVLVYSPQYHEMVGLTINREKIFSIFSSLATENQVPFLDYTESPLSYSRENFYNAQHLNEDGAALFSRDFAQNLVELNISDRPTR